MEGAEACRVQASGMAAMTSALLCLLSHGRPRRGRARRVRLVPLDARQPAQPLRHHPHRDRRRRQRGVGSRDPGPTPRCSSSRPRPTRRWTWSTSNSSAAWRAAQGITTIVDNAFATPRAAAPDGIRRRRRRLFGDQADGRAGPGAGGRGLRQQRMDRRGALPFQRNTGPICAPFNAWVVLKGLETLDLRAQQQSENALEVAQIHRRTGACACCIPGLPSHPQHALAHEADGRGRADLRLLRTRAERETGLRGARCARTDRHLEQYRRCQA